MPYYCTVPRCTSMAGKAKNISFHQFPRDEELAELWNNILKRGKPYTKYSKVCSLHFTPEDYTITSVGKNKGQWRTLKKDAVPSRNLPSDSPGPVQRRNSHTATRPNSAPTIIDVQIQHQMARALYMQSMLAMQAGNAPAQNDLSSPDSQTSSECDTQTNTETKYPTRDETTSYKCQECSKCFKDPDVLILHKRTHTSSDVNDKTDNAEKENLDSNVANSDDSSKETLRANPILANLLKNGTPNNDINDSCDINNVLSIENQILAALAVNMQAYISTLSSIVNNSEDNDNLN